MLSPKSRPLLSRSGRCAPMLKSVDLHLLLREARTAMRIQELALFESMWHFLIHTLIGNGFTGQRNAGLVGDKAIRAEQGASKFSLILRLEAVVFG
jgi:hypothetical protein